MLTSEHSKIHLVCKKARLGDVELLKTALVEHDIAAERIVIVSLENAQSIPAGTTGAILFCTNNARQDRSALNSTISRFEQLGMRVGVVSLSDSASALKIPAERLFRFTPLALNYAESEIVRIVTFLGLDGTAQTAEPPSLPQLAAALGSIILDLFRLEHLKKSVKRRWRNFGVVGILLAMVSLFLSWDIASEKGCRLPGAEAICASQGWGAVPSAAESKAWEEIPTGRQDCAAISQFINDYRNSKSRLVRQAREIEGRAQLTRSSIWTAGENEMHEHYVRFPAVGFVTKQEAELAVRSSAETELCRRSPDPQLVRYTGALDVSLTNIRCSVDANGLHVCSADAAGFCAVQLRREIKECFK